MSRNQSRQVSSWCSSPADSNMSATRGKSSTALQRVGSRGPVFLYVLSTAGTEVFPAAGENGRGGAHVSCRQAPETARLVSMYGVRRRTTRSQQTLASLSEHKHSDRQCTGTNIISRGC